MQPSLSTHNDQEALFVEGNGEYFRAHPNGGGLVSLNARVSEACFVGRNARVNGRAVIAGRYVLLDEVVVGGDAHLLGEGRLRNQALVDGHAVLRGYTLMTHRAHVGGNAVLTGRISLEFSASVGAHCRLEGPLLISG